MEASPVLDIKSTSLYAIRVVLHTSDLAAVLTALDQRMQEAAGFFEDEPVVIDASRLDTPIDWRQLTDALLAHRLPTIGIVVPPELAESAREAGLAQLSLPAAPARKTSGDADAEPAAAPPAPPPAAEIVAEPAPRTPAPTAADPAAPRAVPTMVIEKPLRSGQRIYARQSDLIVLGVVSNGAEVIADGNVHIYGPLRGKAIAGARGDASARIYTTQFEAELVAIAGVYRTMTTALPPDIQDKPAIIRLDGEKLLVEPLPI